MANPTPNGRAGVGGRKKGGEGAFLPLRANKNEEGPPPPLPSSRLSGDILFRPFFFFFLEGKGSADGGGVGRPRLYGRTQGGGGGECAALGVGREGGPDSTK